MDIGESLPAAGREYVLTRGDLELYALQIEKSAEVVVAIG